MYRRCRRLLAIATVASLLAWLGLYAAMRWQGIQLAQVYTDARIVSSGQPIAVMPGFGRLLQALRQPPVLASLVLLPAYLAINGEVRRLRAAWRHKTYQVVDYRHAIKEESSQEAQYLRLHRQPKPEPRQPAYGLEGRLATIPQVPQR